jgi:hypothetical protein
MEPPRLPFTLERAMRVRKDFGFGSPLSICLAESKRAHACTASSCPLMPRINLHSATQPPRRVAAAPECHTKIAPARACESFLVDFAASCTEIAPLGGNHHTR